MKTEDKSYRQILKATSLFGGVQVFNILITIVRSKVIAILLGPTGMGVVGLLTSTTALVGSMTNFGLETSAVKSVAEAYSTSDQKDLSKTVAIFRKLVWGTGILGALVTLVFAPYLSQLTFGNRSYTWSLVLLSVTLLINQLTVAENVLLQGTRQLRSLASANMIGSVASLIITLPLYVFFGLDGIVPALIFMALTTFIVVSYFGHKIPLEKFAVTWTEVKEKGSKMLKLGFFLSLSGLLASLTAYILRIYLSNTGGVDDVGLYTAGFQIIGTYVGLVFTAMGTDYYPRLAAVANEDKLRNELVNQQAVIALLILFPIIVPFIFFSPLVIRLLYSSKFEPINEMIVWAAYAMFFKAVSWAIAFQFLAKANSRLFFVNELAVNTYLLVLNIIGYHYLGLEGLGISYLVVYIIYLIQVYLVTKIALGFQIQGQLVKILLLVIGSGGLALFVNRQEWGTLGIVIQVGFTLVIGAFAAWKLNSLTSLLDIIRSRRNNKS